MIKIDIDFTIHISRGDAAVIALIADDGEYEFLPDDVIRFRVYEKNNYTEPLVEVVETVTETTTEVDIHLSKENTTIGDDINKPVTYWYEISLNETQTIVGYDEDGAKEFIVYPAEKGE